MSGVLLTRPLAQSQRTAALIAAQSELTPIIAPLLRVLPLPWSRPDSDPAALLLTSVNAAEALSGFARSLPVFAVGRATAAAADALGFSQIATAEGDGAALLSLVTAQIKPAAGILLHLSGQEVATDLQAELGALGYQVERKIVYRTEELSGFDADIHAQIARGAIAAVLAYSPKTARVLAGALSAEEKSRLTLVTLSAVIGEAAGPGWAAVIAAPHPSEAALLKTLFGSIMT